MQLQKSISDTEGRKLNTRIRTNKPKTKFAQKKEYMNQDNRQSLTAASTFAGDSSLGLDSIDMILKTILSTYHIVRIYNC